MWLGNMRDGIALLTGKAFERQNRQRVSNVLWNYYKCKDGAWLALSMGQGDRYWPTFCTAIGREDLLADRRFNSTTARRQHAEALVAMLDAVFATRTRDEWEQRLTNAGDLIWERVQTVFDLPYDPQVIANNYLTDFDHPVIGRTVWHQTPVTYSKTPVTTRKMAPQHGEDTQDILLHLLGYSQDDLTALQEARVIL
jgi:crotonobetainyl-CoA:carnitine CoA-transferase CaiB-like acyl-CoA transferase